MNDLKLVVYVNHGLILKNNRKHLVPCSGKLHSPMLVLASQPRRLTPAASRKHTPSYSRRLHAVISDASLRWSRTLGRPEEVGISPRFCPRIIHFQRTRSAAIGRRCGSSFGSECGVERTSEAVINNGNGNCAGRNAVKLFTHTSHWLRGSTTGERRRALETHRNISPEIPNVHKPAFIGGQSCVSFHLGRGGNVFFCDVNSVSQVSPSDANCAVFSCK